MSIAIECVHAFKSFMEPAQGRQEVARSRPQVSLGKRLRNMIAPRAVRVDAVRDVSFEVTRGEIFGILGPNGSGKSTLIRLISTLLLPDSGTITVFGKDVISERLAVRRCINRVSVEAAFFKKRSAMENLEYAARLYDVDVREGRAKAMSILKRLGFAEKKAFISLENLSRGMQQKVAVARALLTSPVLLLLDEPTTGLDPVSKKEVQDFVLEVRDTHDTTVILTTHDMSEAERLCDRIAVIDDGRFVAMDTPQNVRAQFAVNGVVPSLEEAFFKLTGKNLADEIPEGDD
ncbi:MAG: ABC transporter ATP-binding protein [Firmicutes bacterium]|nr:ABC transporter ATP-binding protein [Bacillota bacterium]